MLEYLPALGAHQNQAERGSGDQQQDGRYGTDQVTDHDQHRDLDDEIEGEQEGGHRRSFPRSTLPNARDPDFSPGPDTFFPRDINCRA